LCCFHYVHWIFRDGESRHLDGISEADGRNPAAIGIYGKDDILLIKSCSDFPSTAVTGRWFRPWNTWLGYHFIPFIKRIKSPELRVTTSGHSVFPHDGIISCRIQSLKEIFICGKNQWRSCSPLKKTGARCLRQTQPGRPWHGQQEIQMLGKQKEHWHPT